MDQSFADSSSKVTEVVVVGGLCTVCVPCAFPEANMSVFRSCRNGGPVKLAMCKHGKREPDVLAQGSARSSRGSFLEEALAGAGQAGGSRCMCSVMCHQSH